MIYTDLEYIFNKTGIENKYALAMIVSTRARQLSEQKGSLLGGEGSERCITYAIEEIEANHLDISSTIPLSANLAGSASAGDAPQVD